MSQAKQAAADKNVLVHGAAVAQLALAAGVLDELELHVVPVLFGQGRRLFDNLLPSRSSYERTRILEGRGRRHSHALPPPAVNEASSPPSPSRQMAACPARRPCSMTTEEPERGTAPSHPRTRKQV